MDKHDRPYSCAYPDCTKLNGFNSRSALLRHEKEVHGKHNGSNSQLMYTYPDCKRKGKGFMRKANLVDHIQRMHREKSQALGASGKREATDGNDDAETISRRSTESVRECGNSPGPPAQQPKRRRLHRNEDETGVTEKLRGENKKLQQQIQELMETRDNLQLQIDNVYQAKDKKWLTVVL